MGKKVASFTAFNAYLFCIVFAFFKALPELFRLDLPSPRSFPGVNLDGAQWDRRYLLFLLLSIAGTSIAAILVGAISKTRGGVIAAKSAIPLTLLWIELFFSSLFTGTFGFAALALAAIPLTILISSYYGNWGERMQREYFPDTTVFGIYPYHLIWMTIPVFLSAFITASWLPYFERTLLHNWFEGGFSETVVHLLSLIYTFLPFLGLAALLYIVYKILSGKIFKIESEWAKALLSIGILAAGPILLYRFLLLIGKLMRLIPLEGL
jgi:hypothetical protein